VKLELMDPVEWENLADQIDAEFGQDVAKNLLQDRQPVTLGDGNTKRLHLVSPGWLEHLAQENERNSTFDLRFLASRFSPNSFTSQRTPSRYLERLERPLHMEEASLQRGS
jgi:hypothetical protein